MKLVITAEAIRRMVDVGLSAEQLACVAEAAEVSADLTAIFKTVLETLKAAGVSSQAMTVALTEIAKAATPRRERRRYTSEELARDTGYPSGPKERWGYVGPITPRLHERDWWPLRNSIVRDADHTCHYCDDRHDNMCADHVVPLSRGGTNERDNLVCCCIPCNSSKADRLLSEWAGRYR